MFRSLITLFCLVALAFAAAAPMNQQSCKATDHGLVINYDISIGRYYMKSKCDAAIRGLKKSGALPSMVRCNADSRGMTKMTFNAMRDRQGKINRTLNGVWTAIRDNGGFNCRGH
ncbi:hypothetical protein AC578_937 [Pseudocercospora eumusae]|uniref:Uncharacterized protein n=1 Tax=Pseudocercospora eumusae TaxID=321146 RepID=A0A139HBS8_9PEZI|nr:hypothetical protein AC578_937 [Pseudocercospora eumusae]